MYIPLRLITRFFLILLYIIETVFFTMPQSNWSQIATETKYESDFLNVLNSNVNVTQQVFKDGYTQNVTQKKLTRTVNTRETLLLYKKDNTVFATMTKKANGSWAIYKNGLPSSYTDIRNDIYYELSAGDGSQGQNGGHLDMKGIQFGYQTPDLRGRFILAAGQGTDLTNRTAADTGGAETHKLSVAEMPSHSHAASRTCNGGNCWYNNRADANGGGGYSHPDGNHTSSVGSSHAHNNMPPFYTMVFIVKCRHPN